MSKEFNSSGRQGRAEEMYRHISDYEASRETQREFCIRLGLSKSTFGYWLRKSRAEKPGMRLNGFVPIQVQNSVSVFEKSKVSGSGCGVFLELRYSDGTSLHFGAEVSAGYIRELIPQLRP